MLAMLMLIPDEFDGRITSLLARHHGNIDLTT
jgi:hypothetical protein